MVALIAIMVLQIVNPAEKEALISLGEHRYSCSDHNALACHKKSKTRYHKLSCKYQYHRNRVYPTFKCEADKRRHNKKLVCKRVKKLSESCNKIVLSCYLAVKPVCN